MIDKNNNELCGDNTIHRDRIERAKAEMPDDETLYDLAELFKIFGDTTRVKILCALLTNEMCVCDIAQLLSLSQSAVSHQLRLLKQSRRVKSRRDGKKGFYSLAEDHVRMIIDQGKEHVEE